jgi:spore germination protein YaaH
MDNNEKRIFEILDQIGTKVFPDDNDSWISIQKKLDGTGNTNIRRDRKQTHYSPLLKLTVSFVSIIIITVILLITVQNNQVVAETIKNLFNQDSDRRIVFTQEPFIYIVREGDTLNGIADSFGITKDQLLADNPHLKDNILVVGEGLHIIEAKECQRIDETILYIIEEGDVLIGIASKYGLTEEEIIEDNPDIDPKLLVVGDQLVIHYVIECPN